MCTQPLFYLFFISVMSFKVSKFLLLLIIGLKGVRKIMLANQENSGKQIFTITMVSLVVVKQY